MAIRPSALDGAPKTERARRKAAARPGDATLFASHLQEDEDASATAASRIAEAAAPALLAALLDVQELAETGARSAAARHRAEDLLDRLQRLRLDLLEGRVSRDSLKALGAAVRDGREPTGDERLDALVEAIETRAEIELAKLERS